MIDIKLDSDGDIDVTEFDFSIIEEADLVAQQIGMRLKFFQGEWYLDESFGLPFFDEILVKNPDGPLVSALFKREIITTPGVEELLTFELENDSSRRLIGSFSVSTTYGQLSGEI